MSTSKELKHLQAGSQRGCRTGFTGAFYRNKASLTYELQHVPGMSVSMAANVSVFLQLGIRGMCKHVLSTVWILSPNQCLLIHG